jgi:hypothetical protein
MRQSSTIVLSAIATLAGLAATSASSAAVWGGFGTALGVARIVAGVNQNASSASNATSYLTVQRCNGFIENPPFVVTSATDCVATGPDYQISMRIVSATQTEIKIISTTPNTQIKSITFGNAASFCGFDMSTPNPGTPGSMAGANPTPVTLIGAWTSSVRFDNRVNIAGAAPLGDLYARMTVYFSSCFDVGDQLVFRVDTDKLY